MIDFPKVSVAIVTYNHEKFVAQAIESVLMQEVDFNLEIVVGDDCSTDDTANILHFFQSQYPDKIHLLLNETNLGMHKNFEQVFFACRGKYIALLEGDDYWTSSQKLQQQVDLLEQHPEYALCFHNALIVFEDNRPDTAFCPADLPETPVIEQLFQLNFIPTASVLYRRGLVEAFPNWLFDLKMLDWPLHLLHAHCGKMKYLDQMMSVYRIHAGGVWACQSASWQNREMLKLLETVNQHFGLLYGTVIDESINRFYEKLLISYEQSYPERDPSAQPNFDESVHPMQHQGDFQQSAETTALAVQPATHPTVSQRENLSNRSPFVLKGTPEQPLNFPPGDYVSPGFQTINPDRCFPEMLLGNPADCLWPFLRREIPHNWYVDARYPAVGFLNRDEAHIIYNSALMFRGKRALEIGCWMGWSACHIALAGLELDVIDPVLEKPEFFESVRDSLKRAGVLSSVRLIPGFSPEKVAEITRQENCRWSFMFIDGNHESPGPLNDARMCERFAEDDALMLFHDLSSPCVAEALDYMQRKGWNVMIYHTMQLMAVAWRGNVEPVLHQPDPRVCWQTPSHLQSFRSDLERSLSEVNPSLETLKTTLDGMQTALDWLRLQLKASQEEVWQLQGEKGWFESELHQAKGRLAQLEQAQDKLTQTQAQLEQAQTQIEQMSIHQSAIQLKLQQNNGVIAYLRQQVDNGVSIYLQQQIIQAEQAQQIQIETEQKVQSLQAELQQAHTQIASLDANLTVKRERLQHRKANLDSRRSELDQALGRIAAMETSKFWKMRRLWFNIKRSLGLGGRY